MRPTLTAAIASLGGLLFGYDTGVISGALLFLKKDFALSPRMQDFVVAMGLLGAVGGAAVAGWIADRFGRRRSIIFVAGLFVIGSFLSGLSIDTHMLIAGRLVVGAAIGVASLLVPLYLAEISPPAQRGARVSLNQFCITFGILLSYVIDYVFADVANGWRWMLAIGAVPGAVMGIGMMAMPESPKWLAGAHTVKKIEGSWRDLLRPSLRRPLTVGVGLAIFQQITGINTVIYYAPSIMQEAGLSSNQAAILAGVGIALFNVLMTVVAIFLIDSVGRRKLLLWGLSGMAISLAVLAIGFHVGLKGPLATITSVTLAAYVGAFAIGLGPVFWLLISEIFPLAIRGRAMSVAAFANWGSNMIVALVFLELIKKLGGSAVFALFAAVTVACWVFTWSLVPETAGQSLEEIEDNTGPNQPIPLRRSA